MKRPSRNESVPRPARNDFSDSRRPVPPSRRRLDPDFVVGVTCAVMLPLALFLA
ncbi:MAG: hypothetical protein RIS35_3032 [Pseudomonadota bacterium]|jgi:hypothetical protein